MARDSSLFSICDFCDERFSKSCRWHGYSNGVDEPLQGSMAQCASFSRASALPAMNLWCLRFTALQVLDVCPLPLFYFPLPVDLFNHLTRLEFSRALSWWDAR